MQRKYKIPIIIAAAGTVVAVAGGLLFKLLNRNKKAGTGLEDITPESIMDGTRPILTNFSDYKSQSDGYTLHNS